MSNYNYKYHSFSSILFNISNNFIFSIYISLLLSSFFIFILIILFQLYLILYLRYNIIYFYIIIILIIFWLYYYFHFIRNAEFTITIKEPALCTNAPITGLRIPVIARPIAIKLSVIENIRFNFIVFIIFFERLIK